MAIVASIVGAALALTLVGVWLAPQLAVHRWAGQGLAGRDLHDVAHDARTSVLQAGGVIVVAATIVGAAVQFASTQRTADRAIQLQARGQTRDTFSEAITRLGANSNDQAVQLGAIYTLGQLSSESHAYRLAVLNVLAAYVKEHDQYAPEPMYRGGPFPPVRYLSLTGEDSEPISNAVEAALSVLREVGTSNMQGLRLDFTDASLDFADLEGLTAPGATFDNAHMNFATVTHSYLNVALFQPARLHGAKLSDSCLRATRFGLKTEPQQLVSDMQSAVLERVDAREADFRFVNLAKAYFGGADLSGALFDHADLAGANLSHTNLSGATFLHSDLRGVSFVGATGLTSQALTGDELDPATRLPKLRATPTTIGPDARVACSGPFGRETPLTPMARGR